MADAEGVERARLASSVEISPLTNSRPSQLLTLRTASEGGPYKSRFARPFVEAIFVCVYCSLAAS
jgi:hypothetical protein